MKSQLYRLASLGVMVALLMPLAIAHRPTAAQDVFDTQAYEVRWMGQWISVPTTDGLYLFDGENVEADPLHYFKGKRLTMSAADPVRNRMAVYDEAGFTLLIFEPTTGDIIHEIPIDFVALGLDEPQPVRDMQYSEDGALLAVAFETRLILYNAATSTERRVYRLSYEDAYYVTLDAGHEPGTFITSVHNNMVYIYDVEEDYPDFFSTAALANDDTIYRLEALPAASEIIFEQGLSLVYIDLANEANDPQVIAVAPEFESNICGFDLDHAGDTVAVCQAGGVLVHDLTTHTTASELKIEGDYPYSLAFGPDDLQLVTLDTEGRVQLWDIVTGELLTEILEFEQGGGVWQG